MSTQLESTLDADEHAELVSLRAERAAEAEDAYRDFVVAVSAGERLDDIAGEAILSAARMSHDDFQRDLRQLNGLLNQRAFMVMTYVATTDALASRLQAQ
jgi:hypothetical protein